MSAERERRRSGMRKWFEVRFGIEPILRHFVYHRVTKGVPWYFGAGSALLLLFVTLVATGAFLAIGYSPAPQEAYESVRRITFEQRLGWFVRALHYWSAGMMVVFIVYHVLRQVLMGGYQPPREGLWMIGIVLLILTFVNAFTGYTLRWDERAIYAVRIPLTILHHVPVIGDGLVTFVQGGTEIGASTLSRIFAVHVIFVPLAIFALAGYHLYLVVLHGVTTRQEQERGDIETAREQKALHEKLVRSPETGEDFHPYQTAKSGSFALLAFLMVFVLAAILGPPELYPEANLVNDSRPKEEWWFYWYSALTAYLPPAVAPYFHVLFPLVLLVIMVLLPFVDPKGNRGIRRRPLAVTSVVLIVSALLVLTGLRIRSPWTAWPRTDLPPVPEGVTLTASVSAGRALFTEYGCFNCHAVGGHGSKVGPNLTGIHARLSRDELINYILQPPEDVAMPGYRGRMPEEHLEQVAEFVLAAQTFPRTY